MWSLIEIKKPSAGNILWFFGWVAIVLIQLGPKLVNVFSGSFWPWGSPLALVFPLSGALVLLILRKMIGDRSAPSPLLAGVYTAVSAVGVLLLAGYALFLLHLFGRVAAGQNHPGEFRTFYSLCGIFLGVFTAVWIYGTVCYRFSRGWGAIQHFLFPTATAGFACLSDFVASMDFQEPYMQIEFLRSIFLGNLAPIGVAGVLAAAVWLVAETLKSKPKTADASPGQAESRR